MAIHTPSAIVGQISGKLGGITFINNLQGGVLRTSQRSPHVGSTKQVNQLAKMQRARLRWQVISQADRDQWETLSEITYHRDRLGRRHRFSGFQLFLRINGISNLFDPTIYDSPPVNLNTVNPGILQLSFSASGDYDLNPAFQPLPPLFPGNVWIAQPHSSKVRRTYNNWIVCGQPTFNPTSFPINDIVIAAVGALREGERVGIRYAIRPAAGVIGAVTEQHTTVLA